ncbi:hypothetical protein SPV1_00275 [Mariprofundus ferrooxydans PV-1]|uniref:O-antigen ligase-related domain-containing protein n=2 Tax=Mariprofundus ferrooxydans TaxID=314344 RepID=Q0EYJ9_9PROT|nr:hypothetical protein SPV1_00275 [Mariprofundus ferrooxydans PV-1]
MLLFFVFALVGYLRVDGTSNILLYFTVLNLLPYLIGRFTPAEEQDSAFVYIALFALLALVFFTVSLPELFYQWESMPWLQHPILYGKVSTVGGMDVVMGSLSILATGLILFTSIVKNYRTLFVGLLSVIAATTSLSLLISSRSVVFAMIAVILSMMVLPWRRADNVNKLWIIAAIIAGVALAYITAPENTKRFYGQWDVADLVKAAELQGVPHGYGYGEVDPTNSAAVRLVLWARAWENIKNNPVLGIGARSWSYKDPHPHNVIIESALLFGLPSAMALVIFFLFLMNCVLRNFPKMLAQNQAVTVSIVFLLLFYLILNMTQSQLGSFRSLPLFLLSGFAVACLSSLLQKQRGDLFND